jgi:LmbE family N-acetylglucosaminyl deacetylase
VTRTFHLAPSGSVPARRIGLTLTLLVFAACSDQTATGPTAPPLRAHHDVGVSPATEFFIHASPESWQIYMGDVAVAALQSGRRIVFVSTTAGDNGNTNPVYWQTRESGEIASFTAVQTGAPTACAVVTLNAHPIQRCTVGNATAYFMRLADGNEIDGTGFGQGIGTLSLLRDQGMPASAMDGSTTYASWTDFTATLRALVAYESAGQPASAITVHSPDFIRSINYQDHPDAFATADAVRAAALGLGWTNVWYVDRDTRFRPVNNTDAQHDAKSTVFLAYDNVMVAAGYGSDTEDPDIGESLWRTESRIGSPGPLAPYRGDAYVVAHPDDWQIFMGDRAQASVQAGAKMLFVYLTAGDAGNDSPYWLGREAGALASADVLIGSGAWSCGTRSVRAHAIYRCAKGNAVSYFLRMPDGNEIDGSGFGFGSVERIRDNGETINSIDNSTDYETYEDLSKTIAGVIDLEFDAESAPYVNVNAQDYDRTLNPTDHPDHYAVGELIDAASAWHSWNTTYYVGYDVQTRPGNLTDAQHAIKSAEFQAHEAAVVAAGFSSHVGDPQYETWLLRTYSRPAGSSSPNRVRQAPAGVSRSRSRATQR